MRAIRFALLMIVLFGLGYPAAMTGLAQLIFPHQANGSIIYENGKPVASELIGQPFQRDGYFHGRPSSIQYDASASGSPNYGPSNKELAERMKKDAEQWLNKVPGKEKNEIPIDLITNSGSGLDPHISPAAALFQVPMVAKATGLSEQRLTRLVKEHIEGRALGVFGEPRVNVVRLNMAVQKLVEERSRRNES
ncbi:potassium-transporting ATPase subunit KdpC [Geobacillus icigianus]|uniref:Potassium-transporting ATPase KdpC subunit n=1 Tax=Geobacillus subterraneus TaxID=129338 RepID=A0A679FVQ4_9BACL|nr:potassium-transporting ATPase subunit KdpC [Geobacillus subterraneus]BBW97796.1 potassium-transporting ATPase KdpC subunit [Geobacillus subterraneus]